MDISSILTTLWGKISKPLPNILVGLVFIFLSPKEIQWVGFIFVAIGVSSFFEWLYPKIIYWYNKQALIRKISALSSEEIAILNQIRLNRSLMLNFEYKKPQDLKKQQILLKLEAIRLVDSEKYENFHGSGYHFYLPHSVEIAIKEIVKKSVKSH